MCVFHNILKALGVNLSALIGGKRMSKSIKHEKTQGYLDKLCKIKRERKYIRNMKAQVLEDIQEIFTPKVYAQDI